MSSSSTRSVVLALVTALVAACAPPANRSDSTEDQILEERAREYFDERFRFYPVEATAAGLHDYDGELGQFGASHVTSRVLELRDLRQRLLGIDLTGLSREGFIDALWLTSAIKAELFELEEIERWRRSPRFYSGILCRGVESLLEPWGSPRVEALLSRLEQVPTLLQTAVENLESPSPLAIEQGLADFQRCQARIAELPVALADLLNGTHAEGLQRGASAAQEQIQKFMSHLENNVTPAGPESFRWGGEKLSLNLLYREMEETPLQTIRLIAERRLSETKDEANKLEDTLDADSTAPARLDSRPMEPTEALVAATGEILETLRRVVSQSETMPSVPEVPVPPVRVSRFGSPRMVARLEVPGPLDPSGQDAVFLLTPPSPSPSGRPPDPVATYELQVLALREVFPGKYFRSQAERGETGHSDLRRLLVSRANREGWSHYAAAALLDEGYPNASPRLRLAVYHHRLLELTRLVTTILLHAGDLSLSTAASMFVNEAFVDPSTAEWEARMAALDPMRMSAALGELQIRKLRSDFLAERGDEATVKEFHRSFLSCGELPLRLVRLLLLSGGEGRTLED